MKVRTEKLEKFPERDAISFLKTVNVETGEIELLKKFDHLIEAPNWMRDGAHLVYNAGGKLYKYEIATGESVQIDTGHCVYCNNDHVLSPVDGRIAVSHMTAEDFSSRVYVVDENGGTPRLITPIAPSYLHGWSPDGKKLAYCAERNGNYDIYTIPVDGGEETRLTTAEGLDDGPEYTPDGEYIWFNSVRSGLMQLWRMKADGSEQTQMTHDESNSWFAHISPDGKQVAYITYMKGDVEPGAHPPHKNVEIRLMSAEGGDFRTLVKLFGGQGTLNVNSWSPCGKKIAFVSYQLREEV